MQRLSRGRLFFLIAIAALALAGSMAACGCQDGDDDTDDDADDDTDDDADDDADGDDDFVPPSPAYGYYDEYRWSDWEQVVEQLSLFAEYDLTLFLGMPDAYIGDPDLLDLLREAEAQGVEVRAWVLLPYESGYWPNEANAAEFAQAALAYAEWFRDEDLSIEWIVVDMEMDINAIGEIEQMVADGRYLDAVIALMSHYTPPRFQQASEIYQGLVDDLSELGFHTMVVTYPQVLDDMEDGDAALQDIMDTPVSTVAWDEVSTMVYTTLFEEFTSLPFGPYVVYDYALSTVELFGDGASIALGVSGAMADPQRLAAEVAAAKAAGVYRIQIYSYTGSNGHENPDEWHSVFQAEAETPPPEEGALILRDLLRFVDRLL